jgi:hypothetical protein
MIVILRLSSSFLASTQVHVLYTMPTWVEMHLNDPRFFTLIASSKFESVRTRTLPSFSIAVLTALWRATTAAKRPKSKRFIVFLGGGEGFNLRGEGRLGAKRIATACEALP